MKDNLIEKILKPFNLDKTQEEGGKKLIIALYKILIEKDANLIEINPLIITKKGKIICPKKWFEYKGPPCNDLKDPKWIQI